MKLNRMQLRRLIEGTARELDFDIPAQTKMGLDAFNSLLKTGGYHPKCTAMPSKEVSEYMPKLEIKCEKGMEGEIISFLKKNEEKLINTPGYVVI